MSLLQDLIAAARQRARQLPRSTIVPPPARGASLLESIRGKQRLSVIAEFKRRSPSQGTLNEAMDPVEQARRYVAAGAAAVSVLTEPSHFSGDGEDLRLVAAAVTQPVLMKDFVVDEAQVAQAAALGARGLLLIVRCLSRAQLAELVAACDAMHLTPLIECHDPAELDVALHHPSAVIGVNNRDLETLRIDAGRAERLLGELPADRVTVAESGYGDAAAARRLLGIADAVLMGTALMRTPDPGTLVAEVGGCVSGKGGS